MSTEPITVSPAATDYVLPAPLRTGDVVVVGARQDATAALRRGGEVARTLGDRFLALAESQQLFFVELRERLSALDTIIAEASRAQLKGAVKELAAVLDWCDVVQRDLVHEARLASSGAEPLEVAELCEEIAAKHRASGRQVLVAGRLAAPWWGEATALAESLEQSLAVLIERTQGMGSILFELATEAGLPRVRCYSDGDPQDGLDPSTVRRFRAATEAVGVVVRPDPRGAGAPGLVLELPVAAP